MIKIIIALVGVGVLSAFLGSMFSIGFLTGAGFGMVGLGSFLGAIFFSHKKSQEDEE